MLEHKRNSYHALKALGFSVPKALWFSLWFRKPLKP